MGNADKKTQNKSLIGSTLGVMLVTVVSKVLGFIRTAVVAAIFGASASLDAFNLGITVIGMLTGPSTGMTTVVIPIRTRLLDEQGRERADRFSSSFLNAALLVSFIATLAALLLSPWIVQILSPKAEIYDLTLSIIRIFTPLTIAAAVIYVYCGILNTHKRFIPSNLITIVLNSFWMLGAVLLYKRLGIFAAVIGYMIGTAFQIFVVVPAARGLYRYQWRLDWKDPELRHAFLMCVPIFIGSFSSSIGQAVDKALASSLTVGSVSAINYAAQLIALVQGIIILPIITTVFTSLAEHAQKRDMISLKTLLSKAYIMLTIVLLPITAYCLFFDQEIVSVVYQRGAFDSTATVMTSYAFSLYSLGLLPTALGLAATRCFYAFHDMKTPLYISIVGIVADIVLNYAFIGPLGIRGLALSTSISSLLICIMQALYLRKKIGFTGGGRLISQSWKILIALAGLLMAILLVREVTAGTGAFPQLVLAAVAGLGTYAAILLLLKQEDVLKLWKYIVGLLRPRAQR